MIIFAKELSENSVVKNYFTTAVDVYQGITTRFSY